MFGAFFFPFDIVWQAVGSPWVNMFFFFLCLALFIGLFKSDFVKKRREELVLGLSIAFCLHLSIANYQRGFDEPLMRIYWIFVAMAGSYFSTYRNLTVILASAYVFSGGVHVCLPEERLPYSVWSYLLLTPPLLLAYHYVVSQSIFSFRRMAASELALTAKTKELDSILNSLNTMVALKDRNNVFLNANKAMLNQFGYDKEELIGKSLHELSPDAVARVFHQEDADIIKTGRSEFNVIDEIVMKDGTKRWFRSNKVPIFNEKSEATGIVISAEEVTDQLLGEQKLKESEDRFRMLFEYAPDAMVLVDGNTNKILKANKSFEELFGWKENELSSTTMTALTHPDDAWLTPFHLKDAIDKNIAHYSFEKRYFSKSGREIHTILSVFLVRENGVPIYRIGVIKDITKLKENELKLKRYAQQLEDSNKNLQEFAYAASHDLREPLRTIISYVQLLERRLPAGQLTPDMSEFLRFIVAGSKRMESQITALLEYSRVGNTELVKVEVDLKIVLAKVVTMLQTQITEKAATILFNDLPVVQGDQFQLETLLQNLISNSLKYSKKDEPPLIQIEAQAEGVEWQISITDNGIGVEEEYLEKIFAVFRRLHTQEEITGSGVGLSICRRIVQRHGGKIWAESRYGEGTSFKFTLPQNSSATSQGSIQAAANREIVATLSGV
jgi:PAS domain S-box-containing protein